MTGRIVVGVDGSQQSGNALEWAVARARLGAEQLELVNAYSLAPELDFYGYHGLAASQPVEWFIDFSEQVLDAAAARVHELAPDLICTQTSKVGPPPTCWRWLPRMQTPSSSVDAAWAAPRALCWVR